MSLGLLPGHGEAPGVIVEDASQKFQLDVLSPERNAIFFFQVSYLVAGKD